MSQAGELTSSSSAATSIPIADEVFSKDMQNLPCAFLTKGSHYQDPEDRFWKCPLTARKRSFSSSVLKKDAFANGNQTPEVLDSGVS